jgi:phospholipase/carboxylesterase
MTELDGPRRGPPAGEAAALVVLLHGYGADGHDLIALGEALGPHMPGTVFRAPHAPDPCRVNPAGRQWFPIPWIDGSPEAEMRESFLRAADMLEAHLAAAMAEEGVKPGRTALVGFSQGTMMSLETGPRLTPALAGIVGFSGRIAEPERLGATPSRPPVLLAHGDRDDVIPVSALGETEAALTAAGFPVASHVSAGMGHGIAPDGLGLALRFLAERLGITSPGREAGGAT